MTPQEAENEVWRLFRLLDPKIQNVLKERWRQFGFEVPPVLTQPDHVDAASESLGFIVDKGATDGLSMYFRIERIEADGDDFRLIVLHELAHAYFFAISKFSLTEYREDPRRRRRCELETTRLSKMWFRRIRNLDEKSKGNQNFAPDASGTS